MGNLFVFAIGGTGARVLRSLGILLASGLKVQADKIIPIIIDTDSQNHDTNRAIKLLNNYRNIRNDIPNLNNSFFHNQIFSLGDLLSQEGKTLLGDSFLLKLQETTGKSFSGFINYSFISDFETKSLIKTLYSEQNLEDPLTYGFLGSPNVGCVVLDAINQSQEFKNFGNLFHSDDRIFIISSIFGGTGAAGFPLLLNNLRQINSNLANSNALQNSIIGAVTVLPYFTLSKNENSRIDSSSFYTKSIAALSYYEENLQGINALYYIGDASKTNSYDNVEGGESQKNDANFIELAAALSIYDFMNFPDQALKNNTIYKEFAIDSDLDKMTFDSIGRENRKIISKFLTAFKLFQLANENIKEMVGSTFMVNNQIDKNFFEEKFYNELVKFFNDHFCTWLDELKRNTRGFEPFSESSFNDLTHLINGKKIEKNLLGRPGLSKKHFIKECAKVSSDKATPNEKYIDMMYKASISLCENKLVNLIN
ncbi:MAG: hypothetical protein ACUVQP_04335 [Bacteroidales bacterium]